jgi:hypothetical protein
MRLALVAAALAGCSYSASFDDCLVSCGGVDDCPSGLICGAEGRCRTGDDSVTCASILGDAGLLPPDAATEFCTGTPTTCDTFVQMSDCLDQDGCTFTNSTCTHTVTCSSITTTQECTATSGCQVDGAICEEIPGYCHGLTKSACESLHPDCAYAGGCAGTPRSCESYTERSGCSTHGGCTWNF